MSSERSRQLKAFYEDLCESSDWVKSRRKEVKKSRGSNAVSLAWVAKHVRFHCKGIVEFTVFEIIMEVEIVVICSMPSTYFLTCLFSVWQVFSFVDVTSTSITEFQAITNIWQVSVDMNFIETLRHQLMPARNCTKVEKEANFEFLTQYLAMFCGDLPTQQEVEVRKTLARQRSKTCCKKRWLVYSLHVIARQLLQSFLNITG